MDKNKLHETLNLAYQNHQKSNFDIAKNLYKKILKENPNHFETLFLLGSLSAAIKNFEEGKKLLIKASQINPGSAKVYNNLGIIYKKLRDYEKSIGCYEKAIKLDSNYKIARDNLIEIYELYAKELFEKNIHKKALEFIKMGPGLIRFSNKDFKIL